GAADPEVTADLETVGYHVDAQVSATDACVAGAVSDARTAGGNLLVAVLADEPDGGASAFSAATLAEVGTPATVLVVAPSTVDYADDAGFWTQTELDEALDEAKHVASDNDVVRTFANTLVGTDTVCSNSSVDGKSGWAFIVMFVVIGGGIIYLVARSVRGRSDTDSST
ncbi:MAG: hypothetical protein KDB69_10225, partial [Acidimicrobiia bacterium]|nr:hypothetical protein [Acidimicrobiia bacterium]